MRSISYGPLVDDVDAHVLQDRQDLRQQQPLPDPVDGQPAVAGRRALRRPQPQRQLAVGRARRAARGRRRPARRRSPPGTTAGKASATCDEHPLGLGAVPGVQRVGEVVGPAAGRRGELGLQRLDVDRPSASGAPRRPTGTRTTKCSRASTDSVDRAVYSTLVPPRRSSSSCCIASRTSVVYRSRGQVDQRRPEPAGRVLPQEQPRLPALLQVQHGQRDGQQLVGADLEQLVARIGLQDVEQFLAGVAVGRHPGAA